MARKPKDVVAFGDFQTPDVLALQATEMLARAGLQPATIIEPTCGKGAFLAAAARTFPNTKLVGVDINPAYLADARVRVGRAELQGGDFFVTDWDDLLRDLPQPWLILGNPPWVTVAGLAAVGARDAPARSNAEKWRGIEALTGRSNFDISEWMLREYLRWLDGREGTIAVLCKTAVARKVLAAAWRSRGGIARASLYAIDAMRDFGAAVDAGLLVVATAPMGTATTCAVYDDLEGAAPASYFGDVEGVLVSDVTAFTANRHLSASAEVDNWRSGIKHDCAAVMELTRTGEAYVNGLGETVAIEDLCLYPMLKSADVANGRISGERVMLVPQRTVGEDTARLRDVAPATWDYLNRHAARFAARRSAIYRDRPPFSIFGVGAYTFAPWKVAISGLYKRLAFACIGPVGGKPAVFDDTVSFLPCASEAEARRACALLDSERARRFLESMIFWSDKRPITTALLRRVSLAALESASADYAPAFDRAAANSSLSARAPASMKL